MSVVIFISHGVSGSEGASSLVDLVEAGLQLSEGGIACSSLPGYEATSARGALESAGVVVVWADAGSLTDPRIAFELGFASGLGKWIVVVCDRDVGDLPWALGDATVVARNDTAALRSLVEDIAFQLDLSPRFGAEAASAIRRVSQHPPAEAAELSAHDRPTPRPGLAPTDETPVSSAPPPLPSTQAASERAAPPPPPPRASSQPAAPPRSAPPPPPPRSSAPPMQASSGYNAVGSVPPPPFMTQGSAPASQPPSTPSSSPGGPSAVRAALARAASRPPSSPGMPPAMPPQAEPSEAVPTNGSFGAELAFDAGRTLSECIYHDDTGEPSNSIDPAFGRFVDAIGGDWSSLARLNDADVWNATMDNLLEALPPAYQHLASWYALGFEFGVLINVATDGIPDTPDERAALLEVWTESTGRFRELAWACVGQEAAAGVESQLQDLLHERDFASVARSLGALREHAQHVDASM